MMNLVIFFRTKNVIDFVWFSKGYVSLGVALATIEAVSLGFGALKHDGSFCHPKYTSGAQNNLWQIYRLQT